MRYVKSKSIDVSNFLLHLILNYNKILMNYKIMESARTHREKDSLQRTKSYEHPDILESLELGNRASNKLFGTVLQQNANGDRGTSLR